MKALVLASVIFGAAVAGDHILGNDGYLTGDLYKTYTVDYVVRSAWAVLGPTNPTRIYNDTSTGLGFDATAETAWLQYEIPDCWDGTSDITLKTYIFFTSGDAPLDTEDIDFDIVYRVIEWGVHDVDEGALAAGSVTYTQSGAGDDKATEVVYITLSANDADQPLLYGHSIEITFNRNKSTESNSYSGAVGVDRWEFSVPQKKINCDHTS